MQIFLICPVRGITDEEKNAIVRYVLNLVRSGHMVHWPPRDTDQNDSVGLRICQDNRQAIEEAEEIHVWWNEKSQGSLFDFGMAFALRKKIVLVNFDSVRQTPRKSFNSVLLRIGVDRLAEATGGRLHWNDPGMDAFEQGWKDFPLGTRVEVRTAGDIWRTGTVVETLNENERGIAVKCDERWHDNLEFYDGCGATVMVFMNTRRGILSNIRRIVSKK